MYVLAGCERLLRAAGAVRRRFRQQRDSQLNDALQPLTPLELVLQGTDAGYFQVRPTPIVCVCRAFTPCSAERRSNDARQAR